MTLQPDQQPDLWNNHVHVYEAVFEPLTNAFASCAIGRLNLQPGERLLDVAAGTGGAALIAASRNVDVLAVDASPRMVARIEERWTAKGRCGRVRAEVMDGMALTLPDASFDAAISVFGIILFPDPAAGMREVTRTLKSGGRVAIVTWTEPERYELAARLFQAIATVRGPQPAPTTLPAQLRFRDKTCFRNLISEASLEVTDIVRIEERLRLPSARWLGQRIGFAPGLASVLNSLECDLDRIVQEFVATLERDQGTGQIALTAVAHVGIGRKPI
jgi:SAM-dependent methyltransferase